MLHLHLDLSQGKVRQKEIMKRYLIAVDENGIYFRETLCITHHGDTGEVSYDAKPVKELPTWAIEKIKFSQWMKDKNYGITYPSPVWLQRDWFWRLWARIMCPHGWHLLDEYQSIENHGLLCDACLLDVPLEQVIGD